VEELQHIATTISILAAKSQKTSRNTSAVTLLKTREGCRKVKAAICNYMTFSEFTL